ncbi:CRTAC1 family protein [Kineosporia sp. NBRC 101731]|uniref:CRTAC1 family protein n=1 Tax=Kineosporia sp. NBRC 101731 TaxID=3032199 RepID=UPI0024A01A76|nr:CRTAC1 family protein [Kineosporia sp. NBRC 101731]GLY30379.1 RNA-binding protein [Kineosporia sp. NBRC 101731]
MKPFSGRPGLLVGALALALCVVAGLLTRLPAASAGVKTDLAGRFGFEVSDANADPAGARTIRPVQPALEHIRSWISAVGAGGGLADLDGDGLPDERCLVDPRDDSVTVASVPGAPGAHSSFSLEPVGLEYDSSTTAPMGCMPGDLNEDGWTDVLVYFWGRTPVAYLREPETPLGAAGFVATDIVDEPGRIWNSTTANLVDLDGDGRLDLLIGNYFPDGARVLDTSAANDPLMRMQSSMSVASNAGVNRVLRLTGLRDAGAVDAPVYEDVSSALNAEESRGWTLATGAQDLDADGLPELYLANDFGRDFLLHNESRPGRISFSQLRGSRGPLDPKSKVLGNDSFKSMGVAFTDLNADARPDILVSNITTEFALQESNFAFTSTDDAALEQGRAPYTDDSQNLGMARTGWAWDIKAADFDGDGSDEIVQALGFVRGDTNRWANLQELAMTNDMALQHPGAWPDFEPGDDIAGHQRDQFLVRDGSGRFTDIGEQIGLRDDAVSRGVAIGDTDHDGRPDALIAKQWGRSEYLHNSGPERSYLGLHLTLPARGANGRPRDAVGARVTVTLPDGTTRRQQLYPANGHTGVNAPELLFGLGTERDPVGVEVSWRDETGSHTVLKSLSPGWHDLTLKAAG